MNKTVRVSAIVLGAILIFAALVSLGVAIGVGCISKRTDSKLQVYINENDSVIEQLQTDVNHLTEILGKMQNDSVVVTINHLPKEYSHPGKSGN